MEDAALQIARERLTSDDPRLRSQSLYILGERDDRASLPAVTALLRDEDYHVRVAALHVVGKLRYVDALPDILLLLNDKESLVRAAAVTALGEIGDKSTVASVIFALEDRSTDVREAAVQSLEALDSSQALAALLRALQGDRTWQVRYKAVEALARRANRGEVGPEMVAGLIAALRDRVDEVRGLAALALGVCGDPKALPALEYVAANDSEEHWWDGNQCVQGIAGTAEKAIAAIEARQAGGSPETMEQIMERTYRVFNRMPDYTGCHKSFWRRGADDDDEGDSPPSGQAAYTIVDQINLLFRSPDGGGISAITVKWYDNRSYGENEDPRPEITIPWEAWGALPYCADLLERLGQATGPAMSPDTFADLLRQSGFEDLDTRRDC